ncbi:30S ribosomal protein S17 [Candidatus Uhrbacteria bacterium]|nr:30S ribosomal protein S17 [Candidatus Uhrbacteria bacterium]
MTTPATKTTARRRLQGFVVSTKMAKTFVIRLDRRVPHKKYGKYFTVSTRLKVHDEKSLAKVGDFVEIEETRPLSKDKCWRLISVLKPAQA